MKMKETQWLKPPPAPPSISVNKLKGLNERKSEPLLKLREDFFPHVNAHKNILGG